MHVVCIYLCTVWRLWLRVTAVLRDVSGLCLYDVAMTQVCDSVCKACVHGPVGAAISSEAREC